MTKRGHLAGVRCTRLPLLLGLSFAVWCPAHSQDIQTAFSPNQGATQLVVKTISDAQKSILVAAYSFTSPPVASALIDAKSRGVAVQVVLDAKASLQKKSLAAQLADGHVPLRFDHKHAITHDKMIVVDGETVETGSFNYTVAAEKRNAENVIVIHDKDTAGRYVEAWQRLWDESDTFD